jgi:hypothetical protein
MRMGFRSCGIGSRSSQNDWFFGWAKPTADRENKIGRAVAQQATSPITGYAAQLAPVIGAMNAQDAGTTGAHAVLDDEPHVGEGHRNNPHSVSCATAASIPVATATSAPAARRLSCWMRCAGLTRPRGDLSSPCRHGSTECQAARYEHRGPGRARRQSSSADGFRCSTTRGRDERAVAGAGSAQFESGVRDAGSWRAPPQPAHLCRARPAMLEDQPGVIRFASPNLAASY